MPRFIVTHHLSDSAETLESLRRARRELHELTQASKIQWLNSWLVYSSGQLLCEYEAPDARSIQRIVDESGAAKLLPITRIDEVMPSGPRDFPGEFDA
jgi:hypothetical protein